MRNSKRVKQVKGKCVFCEGLNGTKLSREHVNPDWLRELIKDTKDYTTFFRQTKGLEKEDLLNMYRDRSSFKINQGPAISIKKKNVCTNCNNTWMSKIVNDSKDIMARLVKGENCSIDAENQKKLSNQLGLSSLMTGFLPKQDKFPLSKVSTAQEFYNKKEISANWTIYIGNYVGNSSHKIAGITQFVAIGDKDINSNEYDAIVSYPTFNIGHLFVTMQTIHGNVVKSNSFSETISEEFRQESMPKNLIRIFPPITDKIEWPLKENVSDSNYSVIERRKLNSIFYSQ